MGEGLGGGGLGVGAEHGGEGGEEGGLAGLGGAGEEEEDLGCHGAGEAVAEPAAQEGPDVVVPGAQVGQDGVEGSVVGVGVVGGVDQPGAQVRGVVRAGLAGA